MQIIKKKIVVFTELNAWKEGHKLVVMIYQFTKSFPHQEIFGLILQMRRCAISITSNIAEGFNRRSLKEKIQFYFVALGSVAEIQSQLILAKDIGYLSLKDFEKLYSQSVEVHKLIYGLIKSTKRREKSP